MLTRWNDPFMGLGPLDDALSMFEQLRRQVDRVSDSFTRATPRWAGGLQSQWPLMTLRDDGTALELTADVPGLSEKDIELTLTRDVLGIKGERAVKAPEGYSVHRQERPSVKFSRSLTLPCLVDPERTAATVKDGVLTVRMEKAKEAQPRQISVKAQ